MKFLSPIRIYLISTLLYFFVFGIGTERNTQIVDRSLQKQDSTSLNINLGVNSVPLNVDSIEFYKQMNEEQLDSFLIERDVEPDFFSRMMTRQTFRFVDEGAGAFFRQLQKTYSLSLFFLMPLFALILLLVYRKKELYIGHLVFSIHFHSLVFLILFCAGLLSFLNIPFVYLLAYLISAILLYLWLAEFYVLKGKAAFWRFCLSTGIYGIVLLGALVIIMVTSLAFF